MKTSEKVLRTKLAIPVQFVSNAVRLTFRLSCLHVDETGRFEKSGATRQIQKQNIQRNYINLDKTQKIVILCTTDPREYQAVVLFSQTTRTVQSCQATRPPPARQPGLRTGKKTA